AVDLPGVQLERRCLHWRHDGLGDDCGCRRTLRESSTRSHGHVAILRLSYGRLFPPLDQYAAITERDASHFPCELVPQGGGRQISLARLRRKYACPQVDRGARSRPFTRQGVRRRLAASLRRHQLGWTGFSKGEIRGAPTPGPHRLAQGSYWARRAFPRLARSSAKGTHLRTRTPHLPLVVIASIRLDTPRPRLSAQV